MSCYVTVLDSYGFYCQGSPTGVLDEGLYVYLGNSQWSGYTLSWFTDRVVGELVEVTALVDEYYSLTELNLSYNSIGPQGGKAIGDAFGRSTTLATLDISGNLSGLKGGKAIGDAMRAWGRDAACDARACIRRACLASLRVADATALGVQSVDMDGIGSNYSANSVSTEKATYKVEAQPGRRR